MMGHRQVEQAALLYEFSLEEHVPADHLLRSIGRFVELGELRRELASFYSTMGRPSIDPELMIRIDRGTARLRVVRRKLLVHPTEIDNPASPSASPAHGR